MDKKWISAAAVTLAVVIVVAAGAYLLGFRRASFRTSQPFSPSSAVPSASVSVSPTPVPGKSPVTGVQKTPELFGISGQIDCLPSRGNGSQTAECAIGLRSNAGDYYGLLGLAQEDIVSGKWTTGVRVVVIGDLQPAPGSKYAVAGTISIRTIALYAGR